MIKNKGSLWKKSGKEEGDMPKCNRCLGGDLIESAASFESAVASVLSTQAAYMDTLLRRDENTTTLIAANEQLCNVVSSLKYLEEAIVNKVENGMDIRMVEIQDEPMYEEIEKNYQLKE